MKLYDFAKAKELIEKERESIEEAVLGMHEDWFWTAKTIFEHNEFTVNLEEDIEIGGLKGSNWATPSLNIQYKDGTERMVSCYKGNSTQEVSPYFTLGVLSSSVQSEILPIEED